MFVYILRCCDGSYYTGYTPDLQRRMAAHFSGRGGKYTHAHPPEAVAAVWRCPDGTAARRLEYAIKKQLTRRQKEELMAAPTEVGTFLPSLADIAYVPLPVTGQSWKEIP